MKQGQPATSKKILGIILLTVFLDLVGFSIIFPLFPDMLDYYLGQEAEGGWLHGLIGRLESFSGFEGAEARLAATVLFGGLLGSLYSLLQFIASPIWGALSDQRGRRHILTLTTFGTAVGYVVWVFAGNFWLLVLSRLIGGLMAGNLSVATAAVADVTDAQSRSKGMGMIGAAFGVGFIIGPVIGALLSLWDVSQTFTFIPGLNPFSGPAVVALVLAILNFCWVLRSFPETLRSESSIKTSESESAESKTVNSQAANVAASGAHTATPDSQASQANNPYKAPAPGHAVRPLNPLQLLKPFSIPGVNRTNFLYFVFIVAFAGMEFTLTFLAKDRFGYTAAKNGYLFLFIGIVIAIVQGGVIRRLAPKYGERKLVSVGLGCILPGLLLVAICQQQWMLYLGLLFLAVGSSLVTPSLTALVSLYSPNDRQGEVLGVFRSVGSLGRAFAPMVAAIVYWRFGSHWPYFGSALILLIPLFLSVGLPKPEKMS